MKLIILFVLLLFTAFSSLENSFQSFDSFKNVPTPDSEQQNTLESIIDNRFVKLKTETQNIKCQAIRKRYLKNKPKYYINQFYKKSINYNQQLIKNYGQQQNYIYGKRLGKGLYSQVSLGTQKKSNKKVVIKNLNQVKASTIKKEFSILQELKDCPEIVTITDIVPIKSRNSQFNSNLLKLFDPNHSRTNQQKLQLTNYKAQKKISDSNTRAALVYEHMSDYNLDHFKDLKESDIKVIIYDTLKALKYAHSRGIIHRDIKFNNIVYDRNNKKTNLIDFGLAEYIKIGQSINHNRGTRNGRSPEQILGFSCLDFSLDVWQLGIVFAQLMFKKAVIFPGQFYQDKFKSQVEFFGTDQMLKLISKYNWKVSPLIANRFKERLPGRNLTYFVNDSNKHLVSLEGLDLLEKMMKFDFSERILPGEALKHRYFDSIQDIKKNIE